MQKPSHFLLTVLLSFLLMGCVSPGAANPPDCSGEISGDFYRLDALYEQKVLSDSDLERICYFNNDGVSYSRDPSGETQEESFQNHYEVDSLDPAIEQAILADYVNSIKDDEDYAEVDFSQTEVSIAVYCGEYHDYYAIRFVDLLNLPAEVSLVTVGGFNFLYPYVGGQEVILWKAN